MKFLLKPLRLSITKRVIAIPLLAVLVGVIGISYSASLHLKSTLLYQMKQNAIQVSERLSERSRDHFDAIDIIERLMADKIHTVGTHIIENRDLVSNEFLAETAKKMEVGETNWFSPEGVILYSSVPEYVGWKPDEFHPVSYFMKQDRQSWVEGLRRDSESQQLNKYGYLKADDGSFVQIALPAENVQPMTERFSYQSLMNDMAKDSNLIFAAMLNRDFQLLARASSDSERSKRIVSGRILDAKAINQLKKGIPVSAESVPGQVFEVYVPVMTNDRMVRVLNLAFDMQPVQNAVKLSIQGMVLIGAFMLISIGIILNRMQKRAVVNPIAALQHDMLDISVESNITYRLPTHALDPFLPLRESTNHVLDMTQRYFEEMLFNQDELTAANEELEATIGQLTASEEELRAQYDEIQDYALRVATLKQRYAMAIEATDSYIWEYNPTDALVSFTTNFSALIGDETDRLDPQHIAQHLVHAEDRSDFLKVFQGQLTHLDVRLLNDKSQWQWFMMIGRHVQDRPSKGHIVAGVLVDINKQKEQELYIQYLADHDALTGLKSRRCFTQQVENHINAGACGLIMLMDMDNFKNINDSLSHVYGDKVLKFIAQELQDLFKERGTVYRFGGDEFLIHIDSDMPEDQVHQYLQSLMVRFNQGCMIDGIEQRITASTGIARYPDHDKSVEGLLMKADVAMYEAKRDGKNAFRQFSEQMSSDLREKLRIEQIVRKAHQVEGFMLHYQPVVDVATGQINYFEALFRLKDQSVSPARCIEVAEETGLIQSIGRWVILEAISQLAKWQAQGLPVKPLAVNISPKQMYDPNLVAFVDQQLRLFNVSPRLLELEITENVLMEKCQTTVDTLDLLHQLGIEIALDDFGTGYSSLNYLTYIPVSKIKLDKTLKDKFTRSGSLQVMDSIISLAHGLNLKVVAEGVETLEEFELLKACGSDYVQGYLYSRPVDAQRAAQLIQAGLLQTIDSQAQSLCDQTLIESIT